MRRLLLACLCLLLSCAVSGQVTSRLGRFQIDKNRGCAPFTVTITDANLVTTGDCTAGRPCLMQYTGGPNCPTDATNCQNLFSYTYTVPGTYKLVVLYQSLPPDDITITVDENTPPDFEVYRCGGNDVTIKVIDNHYDLYIIDFDDGSPTVTIPFSNNAVATRNYAAAGTYNIAVRGRDSDVNAADNCTPMTKAVTTITSLPPPRINTLTSLSSTSLRLDVTTQTFIQYRLEIAVNNSTTFQVLQNAYEVSSINVSNMLLDNNFYCFRLSAFDPCTNNNIYSNIVCSQDFDVNFANGTNRLTWRTSTAGVASVTVLRKDITNSTSQTTILPGAQLFHNDADYDCNTEYCYSLTVNYSGGPLSTSLEKCGTGVLVTTHPAIDDIHATVANGATLSWTVDPLINLNEFQISRSASGGPFQILTNTTAESVSDATYTTEGAYCYKVDYDDKCDNRSAEGVIACPVRLFATIDEDNFVTMNWTNYKGWKAGVRSYLVEKLNKNGSVIGTFVAALDTTIIDNGVDLANQVVSYRVRVVPNAGTTMAFSNTVTFTKEVNLGFPTAFSPNGDGLNDQFRITGQFVEKMNIRIFDRWGILVFASERNEPWNGTRDGFIMPESAYVWKAEITDLAGRSYSREGTFLLLK